MNHLTEKAHRELDKMTAEAIGWTWDENIATSPRGFEYSRCSHSDFSWLPHYSSNMSDAWKAIEILMQNSANKSQNTYSLSSNLEDWFKSAAEWLIYDSEEKAAAGICIAILFTLRGASPSAEIEIKVEGESPITLSCLFYG